jgi:hypothetical protein
VSRKQLGQKQKQYGLNYEEIGFAWHSERDWHHARRLELEEARHLVVADIARRLVDHRAAGGRLARFELGERVDELVFASVLVVANVAVAFARQVDHLGVGVVERHENARAVVDALVEQRRVERARVVQRVLTLRRFAEADCEQTVLDPQAARAFHALMTVGGLKKKKKKKKNKTRARRYTHSHSHRSSAYRFKFASTRVADAHLLVLAGGGDARAVKVPGQALDDVGRAVERDEHLAGLDVPQLDRVVLRRRGEHVGGGRVKRHAADLAAMALQRLHRLGEVLSETAIGHVPDLDVAVLGRRRQQIVVERIPRQIEHGRLVTGDQRLALLCQATGEAERHYADRAATRRLPAHGKKRVVGRNVV